MSYEEGYQGSDEAVTDISTHRHRRNITDSATIQGPLRVSSSMVMSSSLNLGFSRASRFGIASSGLRIASQNALLWLFATYAVRQTIRE
jgi:hypothetical protein